MSNQLLRTSEKIAELITFFDAQPSPQPHTEETKHKADLQITLLLKANN